jgi:hypothetical protein
MKREEAPFNHDYRFPDDPQNMIRLQQAWPPGIDAELVMDVHVAGISYEPNLTHARAFIAGHTRTLTLEREPTNRHDRNAIAVIGHWTAPNGGRHQGRLGYVPAETAAEIAEAYPEGPLGAKIWRLFRPSEDKSPGIRMNIGCSMQVYENGQARQPRSERRGTYRTSDQRSLASVQDEIRALKSIGNWEEAERQLVQYIAIMEADVRTRPVLVIPWFYEQLAMLYRRRKVYQKEVALLEHFLQLPHERNATTQRLLERLPKAQALLAKQ